MKYIVNETTFKDGKHTFTMKRCKDGSFVATKIDGKLVTAFSKEELKKIISECSGAGKLLTVMELDEEKLKLVYPSSKFYIK